MRRKYSIANKDKDKDKNGDKDKDKDKVRDEAEKFKAEVNRARSLGHEHIVPIWASYTSGEAAYIISDFVGEHTISSFVDHRMPIQYQRVPPSERSSLLCEWMHCLADALAFLHYRETAHTAIRPSNVLIDRTNHIAFADVGTLRIFQRGKKVNKNEIYDYAAPESPLAKLPELQNSSPPVSSKGPFSKLRKLSSSSSSSSGSSAGSSTRANSLCTIVNTPITPPCEERPSSMSTLNTTVSPTTKPPSFRNFSRHLTHQLLVSASEAPLSPTDTTHNAPISLQPATNKATDAPKPLPTEPDIFALAAIALH